MDLHERDLAVLIPITKVGTSHRPSVVSIGAILMFVSFVIIILRFYTRAALVGKVGIDDWLMGLTVFFFTSFCGCVICLAYLVDNRESLSSDLLSVSTDILITTEVLYVVTMITLKISLGIFFLRILVDKLYRKLVWGTLALTTFVGLGYMFFAIFQCGVPDGKTFWSKKVLGQCVGVQGCLAFGYIHAIIGASTDLFLSVLPIPVVMKAKITKREKMVIVGILALATTGFVASLVRLRWTAVLASTDLSFWNDAELLAIWSIIEPGFGIIAASLATLRPLLRKFKGNVLSQRGRGSSKGNTTTLSGSTTAVRATMENSKISEKDALEIFSDCGAYNATPSLQSDNSNPKKKQTFLLDATIEATVDEHTTFDKEGRGFEEVEEIEDDYDWTRDNRPLSNRATWFPLPRASIVYNSRSNGPYVTDNWPGGD